MNFKRKGPCDTLKWGRIFYFRFNYFCTRLCTPPVFWLKADKTQYHQTVKVIRILYLIHILIADNGVIQYRKA